MRVGVGVTPETMNLGVRIGSGVTPETMNLGVRVEVGVSKLRPGAT